MRWLLKQTNIVRGKGVLVCTLTPTRMSATTGHDNNMARILAETLGENRNQNTESIMNIRAPSKTFIVDS